MDSTELHKLLTKQNNLCIQDVECLEGVLLDYPYAQTLRLLYLVGLLEFDKQKFQVELQKAALYIADRKLLFYLLESRESKTNSEGGFSTKKELLQSEIRESEEGDITLTLIDSFLSKVPEDEKQTDGMELATDYTGYLLEEEEVKDSLPMEGQDLIDDFLNTHEDKILPISCDPPCPIDSEVKSDKSTQSEDPENEDEGFFTETLAKIYVKQGRYVKALEILKKLSLKYPNKNAYFADQIRFLEKLIINDKSK